jgi:hypothetical protein
MRALWKVNLILALRLVSPLYHLGADRIENTASKNYSLLRAYMVMLKCVYRAVTKL